MKILIASDSFKGSLTSKKICELANDAIHTVIPEAEVIGIPLADGGEGTVESLVEATGGTYINCEVTGPLGNKVTAVYGLLGNEKTAVIEMSAASGIMLVEKHRLNPMSATSFGTGELILDAVNQGCTRIIMGIGGSATNDGGVGMLQALGYTFLDNKGNAVKQGGASLIDISEIDISSVYPKIKEVSFVVACDVDNPLIGEKGATNVYGKQKGATPQMLVALEEGMRHFGQKIKEVLNTDVTTIPGAGAAGGMGAGLIGFLNAETDSGFNIIKDVIHLEDIIQQEKFDYIFTGEGQINHQTAHGKLPFGMMGLGKKYGIPVIGIAGSLSEGYENMFEKGLTAAFSIIDEPMSLDEAVQNAEMLISRTYRNVAALLK